MVLFDSTTISIELRHGSKTLTLVQYIPFLFQILKKIMRTTIKIVMPVKINSKIKSSHAKTL